jgi:hypothetical protein
MTNRTSLLRAASVFAVVILIAGQAARGQDQDSSPAPADASAEQPSTATSGKDVMSDSGKEVMTQPSSGNSNLGVGNFGPTPFHVSVAVREGYDDNVYTTRINPISSFFTEASALFDYRFGSPRTTFDLQALAGATYYYNRPFGQPYDIDLSVTLGFEHHFTPRLTLSISSYATYQSEPDLSLGFGTNRFSGNYFYTADKFSLAYQWTPRFSTVTSYTLGVIHYDDSTIGAYEDRFEHTFGNEFRYLALPTTALVGEYRFELDDFETGTRDSDTHFILAGIDHTFSPRFNLSFRGGVEFRDYETFGDRTSPYAEGTVHYALGKRTSVDWISRYGLEDADVPGTPSRTTFRTGLTFSYGITQRITATGSAFYQHDDNEALNSPGSIVPAFSEDSLDIGIGLRYEINRVFALLAGYSYTQVFSDIPIRDYSRNRYYLGLDVTL